MAVPDIVRHRVLLALIVMLAALSPVGLEGEDPGGETDLIPRVEVGPYLGVSRHSPAGRYLGAVPDRNHLFVGVQLTVNAIRTRRWAFAYAPEVVPLLVVSNNPTYRIVSTRSGARFRIEEGRAPVAGFAVSPIGVETQVRVARRWRAYAGGAAGVVWFTREVPVVDSRAFNYTFELGGGVRWQYGPRESVRIGVKLHHLSNAYTAERNPGLDALVVLVGYERGFGGRNEAKR